MCIPTVFYEPRSSEDGDICNRRLQGLDLIIHYTYTCKYKHDYSAEDIVRETVIFRKCLYANEYSFND